MSSRCLNSLVALLAVASLSACDREERQTRGKPLAETLPAAARDSTSFDARRAAYEGNAAAIAQGQQLFGRYCQVCHGASAGGGGVLPDLQRSAVLADADTWKSILIDGALAKNGMVSFAKVLSPEQAQLIRLYIIDEANWAKKNLPQEAVAATGK